MTTQPSNVVVLDRSDSLVLSLSKAVDDLHHDVDIEVFTRAPQVAAMFDTGHIDVLLVGPSELTATGLRRVASWHAAHPATMVMVAADASTLPDPALLIKAGVEQLLRLPAGPAAVRRALDNALEVAQRRREALGMLPDVEAEGLSVVDLAPEPDLVVDLVPQPQLVLDLAVEPTPEPDPAEPGVTITVASATGGCGKTFLTTNLAYLLAQRTGKRVAVVDLDLQFGEVVAALQLKPSCTIADAVLDADGTVDVRPLMTHHHGGFDVLAAPRDPVEADHIDVKTVAAVIAAVRREYDFVLIDTPPSLNEVVLTCFDVSDELLVLATLDVPSIRNMRVFLTTLERLRIPQDGLHLVLNKAERNVELSSSDIRKVLGRGWDLELPYDRQVSRSVNLGLPVSESAPGCEVSKRLVAGVARIVPDAALDPEPLAPELGLVQRLLGHLRPSRPSSSAQEKTS